MNELSFSQRVKAVIKSIPYGRVATYGQVAFLAGNHRAARQTAWVLHSSSNNDGLPWHRVVNRNGKISLPPGEGLEEQRFLLENEGVCFDDDGKIDLNRFMFTPII